MAVVEHVFPGTHAEARARASAATSAGLTVPLFASTMFLSGLLLFMVEPMAATIGIPFFVLSTSASVFQYWLSRTDHPSARDPYFLYSASNLGCLLALASYPTIVEPMLTLREQSRLWTFGYALFVALAAGCAAVAWRRSPVGRAVTR